MRRTRALQRQGRKAANIPTVATVGYTNAGKSSLVAALCGKEMCSADQLFATLDPRLRRVVLPSGLAILVSDTVGFISDLPISLIAAFK